MITISANGQISHINDSEDDYNRMREWLHIYVTTDGNWFVPVVIIGNEHYIRTQYGSNVKNGEFPLPRNEVAVLQKMNGVSNFRI